MSETKICKTCGRELSLDKFRKYPKRNKNGYGFYSSCKQCLKIKERPQKKLHYEINRDKYIKFATEWSKKDDEKNRCLGIYFIEQKGFVKIGKTNNLKKRISTFQIYSPHKVNLLYFHKINRNDTVERIIHEKFEHLWVRGEWYIFNNEIKNFMKSLGWRGKGAA